ncbi:FAD-binding oxidoreductase [Neptunicoccus cionae]|uniref:nitric oxide dioxygenase n=1 Tax=Neptunicoccus cionae TaxID=2035344 RepID=A0A916VSI2_9RHOB|nr:pyridoxamine 5'-phosphate oxidase family protein [Amylibacter cionae]GGA28654.1 hypothetical protein GCM10011498_32230 [Amylibacter cionae]
MKPFENPFHTGEQQAQNRAGAIDVAKQVAGFIRPFMPDQHRAFYEQLPFIVLAGADAQGRRWATLVEGPDGFVKTPDAKTLAVETHPATADPLADTLTKGGAVGVLGIELETRRRNRLSGIARKNGSGFAIDIQQSWGNCPQYIHPRNWRRRPIDHKDNALYSKQLDEDQIARIRAADTLFLGTGQTLRPEQRSSGFDASHRGGAPGFVKVVNDRHLAIPDYPGNNFFNTIGNLLLDPRIGLVFVDFESGGLLHISGTASIDWTPTDNKDAAAQRLINVTIDAVVDRPNALSLRWTRDNDGLQNLILEQKVKEAEDITSFYFVPENKSDLTSFKAGQFLPVELEVPGQRHLQQRSYSLSGSPNSPQYRLTIKREPHGLVSPFVHDTLRVGDRIRAYPPAGDFTLPPTDAPLVLASVGVGLTPLLSMLHEMASTDDARPVWFVHGARNGAKHALATEVRELLESRSNLFSHICYSQPRSQDISQIDYDSSGRITSDLLIGLSPQPNSRFMLCGPASFVSTLKQGLEKAGIPEEHIRYETFGPLKEEA